MFQQSLVNLQTPLKLFLIKNYKKFSTKIKDFKLFVFYRICVIYTCIFDIIIGIQFTALIIELIAVSHTIIFDLSKVSNYMWFLRSIEIISEDQAFNSINRKSIEWSIIQLCRVPPVDLIVLFYKNELSEA
jgi:hypothetical protein